MSSYLPKTFRTRALAIVVLVLGVAALYEAAMALRIIPMGKVPGEGAGGAGAVMLIALLAMLLATSLLLTETWNQSWAWKAVALVVAAVFLVVSIGAIASAGGVAESIALLALFIGIVVLLAYHLNRSTERTGIAALVAPAAAAFVLAHFFTFDDYYLPTLVRMSERDYIPWQWIAALVAVSLLAGVLTRIRPRIGIALTSVVLLLSAITAVAVGVGH